MGTSKTSQGFKIDLAYKIYFHGVMIKLNINLVLKKKNFAKKKRKYYLLCFNLPSP